MLQRAIPECPGRLTGSRRSGTVLCWHSHRDPPPACSTASSSAIPIQTDCWDNTDLTLLLRNKKPKRQDTDGNSPSRNKGGTRLAKRSLFRLTALRSLQHNSSLSSPLRHHLPSKISGSGYVYTFNIRKAQAIPRSKIIIFYKHVQQTY